MLILGEERKNIDQQRARRETPGVVEQESGQQVAAREVPGVVERESAQQAGQRAAVGKREEENDQRCARRKTLGVGRTQVSTASFWRTLVELKPFSGQIAEIRCHLP
jgi:hypothetical protein